jgi:hypothetical protein
VPVTSAVLPGVVADCTGPASTRPSVITLACADAGIGVQGATWTTWASSGATGQGRLWLNLCQPNCAAGKVAYYPVQITLSGTQASAHGRWFSDLAIAWESPRPSPLPLTSYDLMSPS